MDDVNPTLHGSKITDFAKVGMLGRFVGSFGDTKGVAGFGLEGSS